MTDRLGKSVPGVSPEQRERDGRLAWMIVAGCAVLSLTLIVGVILMLSGPAARWAQESMAETERQQDEEMRRVLKLPPVPDVPELPASSTAEPVGEVMGWIGPDDYPSGARRRGEEGRVRVTVSVDEEGYATGCSTYLSSGFGSLDAGTCHVMMSNGRWNAAPVGEEGVRRWTSPPIRWTLPE